MNLLNIGDDNDSMIFDRLRIVTGMDDCLHIYTFFNCILE